MNCIFCKIVSKNSPAEFIYEDGEIIVIKDINPKAPVHLLVLPKIHISSVSELTTDQKDIVSKLIYVARDIAKEKSLSGYKLVFNVGKEGGQMVDHVHLHVLGGVNRGDKIPGLPV